MGTFEVQIQVANTSQQGFVGLQALVDTGSTHTMFPRDLLVRLGIQAIDRRGFRLADERRVVYEVGEARIRLDGRERTILVVFGPEGVTPIIGATTLELFNLGVDPAGRRLVPVDGLLK